MGVLTDLALLFLRLGCTAFGGPAAHIAMMREEVVHRRGWLTEAEFLDLLGAANLIPGPNSTELAIHIGLTRGGWRGLLVAGTCFILPAALMVGALAAVYVRVGSLPQFAGVLYGIKPVVIAVVAQAIFGLLKPAAKSPLLATLGIVALALTLLGVNEVALLFGTGGLAALVRGLTTARKPTGEANDAPAASTPTTTDWRPLLWLLTGIGLLAGVAYGATALLSAASANPAPPLIFLYFLKIGSVLYGSGYVLLAFLRDGLVHGYHWMTGAQLLDAVAVGQVTPGPVFTTATFVGYVVGGPLGAIAGTVGIFLPAFLFVGLSGRLVPVLRGSPVAGAFLDGVNVAALALMVGVTWQLGRAALVDVPTIVLAAVSALLLIRWKVNSAWLLLAGAVVGFALSLMGIRG